MINPPTLKMPSRIRRFRRRASKSISNPKVLLREINRIYYSRRSGPGYNHEGIDIFEEEWDTLVVLDACRYDMFAERNTLPGHLEQRISRGSHTSEFLRGNFGDQVLLDTVYTTASPQLEQRRDEIDVELHAENHVWNTDRWDTDEGTVMPEAMTDAGLEAHENFPNKRHIVHYMQPHYPFIGSGIDSSTRTFRKDISNGLDIWGELFRGNLDVDASDVWKSYQKNLDFVLDEVERLLEGVNGRVVVTSDHGNMIGKRASPLPIREWGHPPRLYTDALVTVPWLVNEGEERRETTAGQEKMASPEVKKSTVDERLKDLGYLQ
jgi:hypothetical protein